MSPVPATPAVGVYAEAALPDGQPSDDAALGGAGSVAVATGRGFYLEADLLGGPTLAGGFTGAGWLGGRYHLGGRSFDTLPSMSLLVGAGGTLAEAGHAALVFGAAADLPARYGLAPRLAVDWLASPWDAANTVVVRLGVVAVPGRTPHDDGPLVVGEPPAVEVPAASEPPPAAPPSLVVNGAPADARVWLAHPYCSWVPLSEVQGYLDRADPPVPASVHARGFLPAWASLDGPTELTLQPAPPQGTVVVVASPGDEVRVGGAPVSLGEDGAAFVQVLQGIVEVTVVGGGRAARASVAAESGYASWVRMADPTPWRVTFAQGSAVVTAAARRELAARVSLMGQHPIEIHGSYSAEGNEAANLALAQARAEATRAALVALGVAPDRVRLGAAQLPDAGLSVKEQRAAVIVPLPAGAR